MKFLYRLGQIIQTAFMAGMTVFIVGFLFFVGFGSYWAVNTLDERYFGQCVDLGGGATGRVVKIASWWSRGGPHVTFDYNYSPIADGTVLVSTGAVQGYYSASSLKVVDCP